MAEAKTLFDALLQIRDDQRAKRKVQVLRGKELPVEETPIGRLKWYMHPLLDDRVVQSLNVYEMELPPGGRSGRMRYQGGMVIFVVGGTGRTVIDGEIYPWEKDAVIQLPLRPDHGVVYQHFNTDPEHPARLLHAEPNTVYALGVDRGSGFEVLEPARND